MRCFILVLMLLCSLTGIGFASEERDEIMNSEKAAFYLNQFEHLGKQSLAKTREFDNLIKQLDDDEVIQAVRRCNMYGSGNGLFLLTQKRIVFIDEYGFTSTTVNIKLDNVTSVIDGKNLFYAFLNVSSMGERYMFYNMGKKEAPEIAEYIRKYSKSKIDKKNFDNNSVVSELERLVKLKESGVLSDEEFDAAKLKLLN